MDAGGFPLGLTTWGFTLKCKGGRGGEKSKDCQLRKMKRVADWRNIPEAEATALLAESSQEVKRTRHRGGCPGRRGHLTGRPAIQLVSVFIPLGPLGVGSAKTRMTLNQI